MDGTQFQLPGHARKLESQNNVVEVFLATLGAEVPGAGAEPVPPTPRLVAVMLLIPFYSAEALGGFRTRHPAQPDK